MSIKSDKDNSYLGLIIIVFLLFYNGILTILLEIERVFKWSGSGHVNA